MPLPNVFRENLDKTPKVTLVDGLLHRLGEGFSLLAATIGILLHRHVEFRVEHAPDADQHQPDRQTEEADAQDCGLRDGHRE